MVDRIVAYVMQIHRIEKQFSFHNADIIALYTIHLPGMIWSPTPLLRKMVQKKSPWNRLGMIKSVFLFV